MTLSTKKKKEEGKQVRGDGVPIDSVKFCVNAPLHKGSMLLAPSNKVH